MTTSEILDNIRQKYSDAEFLNSDGRFANSIYLCGYCVELALKFAITNNLKWTKFNTEGKFKFLKVHDLNLLVALSGDELRIKKLPSWAIVQVWDENMRYEDPTKATKMGSDSMLTATKILVEDICAISL